ncbi:hypothetical protein [Mesorhizobium sp. M0809]|uniref:hypothetical protein n=1 Tax=Mesorhizobium sp. M0809 TaxID=2957003 RepID=UPI003334E936
MQPQCDRPIRPIGAHGSIRKRRIAERKVEMCRQVGAGEIAGYDPRSRLQQPGDARGDGIEFDPGDVGDAAQGLRHQRRKQAGSDAWFKNPTAAPSETLEA